MQPRHKNTLSSFLLTIPSSRRKRLFCYAAKGLVKLRIFMHILSCPWNLRSGATRILRQIRNSILYNLGFEMRHIWPFDGDITVVFIGDTYLEIQSIPRLVGIYTRPFLRCGGHSLIHKSLAYPFTCCGVFCDMLVACGSCAHGPWATSALIIFSLAFPCLKI